MVRLWKAEQPFFTAVLLSVRLTAAEQPNKKLYIMKTFNQIPKADTMQETVYNILEETNTNWTVKQLKLISSNIEDANFDGLATRSTALFRNDTKAWLGTMGEQYEPMQNHELCETIVEAAESFDGHFRGGQLQGGRKIFYQIQIPDYKIGHDTLKRYLTVMNSHDGSTSIGFGSSNTVVSCGNTFYSAYAGLSKFRHTTSAKDRIEVAKKELMLTLNKDNYLMNNFEKMTQHAVDKNLFENIMKKLFKIDSLDITAKEVSKRTANKIEQFNDVYAKEITSHGDSLWGLFNAVTFFENHVVVKEDKKLQHIYIGSGKERMNLTYNEIMKFITATEKPKKELVLR